MLVAGDDRDGDVLKTGKKAASKQKGGTYQASDTRGNRPQSSQTQACRHVGT